MSEYMDEVINRAALCQATDELPYPMCYLPMPMRCVAIMVGDRLLAELGKPPEV